MAEFKFEFEFTKEKLKNSLSLYEGDLDQLYELMCKVLPKYRLSTPERLGGFIDQFELKSKGFTDLKSMEPTNDVMVRQFSNHIKMPIGEINKYCSTLEGALDSAGWFWNINYLNIVADNLDVKNLSKRINPDADLEVRKTNFLKIRNILKG